jgi:hypothetical protein
MRKIRIILPIVFLLILALSCDWILKSSPCESGGPVIVYKTRLDYSNNVTVQLSADGKKITAYPGQGDVAAQKPIQLANGYLLKKMPGDVVLSLTIDEYAKSSKNYSNEDFINLIIDRNPYLEKYECCKCISQDTAEINDLIRNNKLSKCDDLR